MEFVYVVPRKTLFPDCYPQGLVPFRDEAERCAFEARVQEAGFFVEREVAEENPDWKQIIPYNVVRRGAEFLLLRRLGKGGERRLHDKLSIGVGGHINPEDLSSDGTRQPIRDGARREIEEELSIDGTYELTPVGYLNDDSNAVGAVHLGLVQLVEVDGSVAIRETDVLEGRLVSPTELREAHRRGDNFETWSSILIDRFDAIAQRTEPLTA